jgi:hypothetical protein
MLKKTKEVRAWDIAKIYTKKSGKVRVMDAAANTKKLNIKYNVFAVLDAEDQLLSQL